MTVGEHIRALREARGITLENMSERIGYSVSGISQWERGVRRIAVEQAIDIADYFNMTLDCLVMRERYTPKTVSVGERMKRFREERDLSRYELAERIGSSQLNIRNWEHRICLPRLDMLQKICDAFGITLEEFMKGVEIN